MSPFEVLESGPSGPAAYGAVGMQCRSTSMPLAVACILGFAKGFVPNPKDGVKEEDGAVPVAFPPIQHKTCVCRIDLRPHSLRDLGEHLGLCA